MYYNLHFTLLERPIKKNINTGVFANSIFMVAVNCAHGPLLAALHVLARKQGVT